MQSETSEPDHTRKRHFRSSAICQTKNTLTILRCSYGLEMVFWGLVIGKQKIPSTDILQENDHAILLGKCQIVAYRDYYYYYQQQWAYTTFFPKSFHRNIIRTLLSVLSLARRKIVHICDWNDDMKFTYFQQIDAFRQIPNFNTLFISEYR